MPHSNRLIDESSPYLQQHARNPVDWYPWGPEAFARARAEDKCIFLSVGYSTCYWCHVMERESFESEAIAAEMNARFINIKVDREQRPDVDQLYMTAVQVLTRHGGWPMSVFLTPDLRPFWGGTYIPPDDRYGRAGFPSVLAGIDEAWRNRRDDVLRTAERLHEILRELAEPRPPEQPVALDTPLVERVLDDSTTDYDRTHGGFGGAPKFPRQTLLELILSANARRSHPQRMKMLTHTLHAMADGGIRDQIGGAFHRYSTDERWLVPHFEIMLYDNAMLAYIYAEAHRQTGEARFAEVARGIADFVISDLTDAHGTFHTAIDAEVDAREGASYLWTADEVTQALGPDATLFCDVYGLSAGPNFSDPHHDHGRMSANVLHLPQPLTEAAGRLDTTAEALEARLAPLRQRLLELRRGRKQPGTDTKLLTSWNGLMVRGLAKVGGELREQRYLDAAARAADRLLTHHRAADGTVWRDGGAGQKHPGFLDDYAFLAQGLLELHRWDGQPRWRNAAGHIVAAMRSRFFDADRGGAYFTAAGADDLIIRQKVGSDSPLPSGCAVAAMVMCELGGLDAARHLITPFAGQVASIGAGMSAMVQALDACLSAGPAWTASAGAPSEGPSNVQEEARDAVRFAAEWVSRRLLRLHVSIAEGLHVQAHDTPSPFAGLTVTPEATRQPTEVRYPASQPLERAGVQQRVYPGEIVVELQWAEDLSAPSLAVAVRYQVCSGEACYPQVTRRLGIDLPS